MNVYFIKHILISIFLLSFIYKIKSDTINETKNEKKINSKKVLRFCGVDQIKPNISFESFFTEEEIKKHKKRKLDENEYEPIRIFLDTTYILSQGEENPTLKNKLSILVPALERCVKIFEKLLKVIRYTRLMKVGENYENAYGIKKINNTLLSPGISSDLIIFARFTGKNELSSTTLANAGARKLDYNTKRPIIGVININPNIDFSLGNSANYVESILLHEITHILGFSITLFEYFPKGLSNTLLYKKDTRIGLNRTYIKTPKLIEVAKKYFNCDRIDGIELENQGGSGTAISHWEARILLGDYMNGVIFTIEQVISEFTLAVLEDSTWYKINYYTGGLMRYGKHQGCDFIEKDCLNQDLETQFNNDFFNIYDSEEPRCSSGRQSRGYNILYKISSVENDEYLRFNKQFGSAMADYCPVCQELPYESRNTYYVGNCQRGNYNYGTRIIFDYQYGYDNNEIPKTLGEKFTENSFCSLTSVIPKIGNKNYNKYKTIHPACYPMFCSEKSLTIQINDQYIVCPRQGGKVSISKNYEGYIYCPDYNLICTGTVLCNDMFDCVEKESLIKDTTYDYDYIINNSQDISQIEISNVLIGYELSDDGVCPKNCIQCLSDKKCFQCLDGYKLIGQKEDDSEPIICSNDIDTTNGYYLKNNVYYKCIKDCVSCKSGDKCDKCVKNKRTNFNKNECINLIENCENYDNNENCIKCYTNYAFIGNNRNKCISINDNDPTGIDVTKYYTEDNGISYFPCDTYISNCDECTMKEECNKCISSHIILDNDKSVCINKKELDEKKSAYKIDEYNYKSCSKSINNCIVCNSESYCLSCEEGYGIVNDIHSKCEYLIGIEQKFYYEESNGVYYFCNKSIEHCEECSDKDNCNLCKDNYNFDPYNKCQEESLLSEFFIDENNQSQKCSNFMENCKFCTSEDFCTYCDYHYSFLNNGRNKCISESTFIENTNYYTIDKGINYYNCDIDSNTKNITGIRDCSDCLLEDDKLTCIKCKELFGFLDNDFSKCFDIKEELDDKIKNNIIYTLDNGINYYTCEKKIENCKKCINDNLCLECLEDHAFLNDNFKKCYNKRNFEIGYYSNENNTIYYPCLANCSECIQSDYCVKCILNYAFIGDDRTKCINTNDTTLFDIKKYYTEDNGISYYPCDTLIENCDECVIKDECNKCRSDYIILDNDKSFCINKKELDEKKIAYTIDEYNYKSCSKSINNCITCNSENYCLSCEEGYGIVNDIHSKCEYLIGIEQKFYYEESNGIYYSCNKSLKYCEECIDKEHCILCSDSDNYILPYNESQCIDINEKKLFYFFDKELNNYKKCKYGIDNCLKCSSENYCLQCDEFYTLFNNNTEKCEIKSFYENNNEYISLDFGTNYYKCGHFINNCFKCKTELVTNEANCYQCNNNYTILDDKAFKCYSIEELNNLIINDEIYSNNGGINYYSCNVKIKNCNKCTNDKNCLLCDNDFALYEEDNSNCYSKDKFKIGFFSNENKTRYYSCLSNCDRCNNKTICEKCSSNYMPNEIGDECLEKIINVNELKEKCVINIKKILDEEFELLIKGSKTLESYIYEYQQKYKNNNYVLNHYYNDYSNFSMTLFKYSECSLFLIEKGKKKISTDNIIVNLGNYLDSNNVYIQSFIQFNNKISYSLYDSITMENINIKKSCLNCKQYQIINNYTNSLSDYIGNSIISLIQNENINLFNVHEDIFNDECYNLTINNIDFPFYKRKSKFYLGNTNNLDNTNENIILCGDPKCTLIKDNKDNLTSICNCPIEDINDINSIFIEGNKVILENNISSNDTKEDENSGSYNSFYILKCFKISFNLEKIKNNFGFSFSIAVIGTQIICYIITIIFPFYKSLLPSTLPSPPKRTHKTDDEEKCNYNNFINDKKEDVKKKDNKNNKDNHSNNMITDEKVISDISEERFNKKSKDNKKEKPDLFFDYLSFKDAKDKDERTFCHYYWHLLFFNQLILNLLSFCSCNIAETYLPFPLKLIKLLFLYMINLFITAFLINDTYLLKKYNFFNEKYDIENNIVDISINEKISFSIKNGKNQIVISFFACLFVHYVLSCFLNIRKKVYLNILNTEGKNKINKEEIKTKKTLKTEIGMKENIKYYLEKKVNIFMLICLLLMIIIFSFLTNFCAVYSGTEIDIIILSLTSFIILQIAPFIICYIVAVLRYLGLKADSKILFLINKCLSGFGF